MRCRDDGGAIFRLSHVEDELGGRIDVELAESCLACKPVNCKKIYIITYRQSFFGMALRLGTLVP